eukprot:scaffold940_cov569-Prasinococcus_capsulatus_cf.AAC.28
MVGFVQRLTLAATSVGQVSFFTHGYTVVEKPRPLTRWCRCERHARRHLLLCSVGKRKSAFPYPAPRSWQGRRGGRRWRGGDRSTAGTEDGVRDAGGRGSQQIARLTNACSARCELVGWLACWRPPTARAGRGREGEEHLT